MAMSVVVASAAAGTSMLQIRQPLSDTLELRDTNGQTNLDDAQTGRAR